MEANFQRDGFFVRVTAENLTTKRPGDGISPMRWYDVLGKTAKRDFAEDEKIEL